jgi:hypothetical protein
MSKTVVSCLELCSLASYSPPSIGVGLDPPERVFDFCPPGWRIPPFFRVTVHLIAIDDFFVKKSTIDLYYFAVCASGLGLFG